MIFLNHAHGSAEDKLSDCSGTPQRSGQTHWTMITVCEYKEVAFGTYSCLAACLLMYEN